MIAIAKVHSREIYSLSRLVPLKRNRRLCFNQINFSARRNMVAVGPTQPAPADFYGNPSVVKGEFSAKSYYDAVKPDE